jgi:hypothetical protein
VIFERHSISRPGLWYNHPSNRNTAVDLRTAAEEKHTLKRITITLLALVLLAPSTAFSQTRNRSSRPKAPTTTNAQRVAQVRTQGATRLAEQIKNLSRFMYLLGGVTSSIAAVEDAARKSGVSPADQTQQSKAQVKATIQNIREGLDKLEIDFRATPELQPYYIKLAGVAAGAAAAEERAGANQFDAAGRQLLNVVNRLTDVLLLMRTTD